MSGQSNLSDLGGAIQRCIHEIERAQSALMTARDRASGAQQIIAITGEGSNSDLVASAMTVVALADVKIEETANELVSAIDSLQQYAAQKGLG